MIAASALLVVIGAVLLVLGVLEVSGQPLTLVYASIGASLLAALLLAVGVLRSRPAHRGAPASRTGEASWGGAPGRADDLPDVVPAPAPWSTVSEAQEAEAVRLDALLADVPGLEPEERRAIRARYASITELRAASRAELVAIEGVSEEGADRVLDALA